MKLCKEICKKCINEWNALENDTSETDKFNGITGWSELDEDNWRNNGKISCPYFYDSSEGTNQVDVSNANPTKCKFGLEQLLQDQENRRKKKENKNEKI